MGCNLHKWRFFLCFLCSGILLIGIVVAQSDTYGAYPGMPSESPSLGAYSPGFYPSYPYYPYYPYYPAPAVIQQPATDIYVQPAPQPEEADYWYYCQEPQGYYPNVKECPKGWLKVVPPVNPPE
jgi:hypothetical protein